MNCIQNTAETIIYNKHQYYYDNTVPTQQAKRVLVPRDHGPHLTPRRVDELKFSLASVKRNFNLQAETLKEYERWSVTPD